MDAITNLAKKIYRRVWLSPLKASKDLSTTFKLLGPNWVSERSIVLGEKKFRIKSLTMEATPGTVETIISLVADLPQGTTLLDYGCGQHQSQYLKKLGFNVTSCDILDFNFPGYVKIDPKAKQLPFHDKQFDVAIISEVVEHVECPWDLLQELKRITQKMIIVTTPNIVSKKSKQVFMDTGFFHWFTPDVDYHITPIPYWQMQNFCKRHGMKIKQMLGNHEVFGLAAGESVLDNAEVLIFEIQPHDA